MWTIRFYDGRNNPIVRYHIWGNCLYTAIFDAWNRLFSSGYPGILEDCQYSYERTII